jgi:hypothetical protein
METHVAEKYINLLKKSLSFTLWPEPPIHMDVISTYFPAPIRHIIRAISKCLSYFNITIAYARKDIAEGMRIEGMPYFSLYAETMIGIKRLNNLQFCIESVLKDKIDGDLIETGVWRGGACIFMKGILAANGVKDKKVFVADSFEGLPKPNVNKYPVDKNDKHYRNRLLAISVEYVKKNFQKYELLDDDVVFLKGWFEDTLPAAPIRKLSVMRLDGDMYGSTMEALIHLYPKLQPGGYCIIDDYGAIENCKKAVDDFRSMHNVHEQMNKIDWTGYFWRKQ